MIRYLYKLITLIAIGCGASHAQAQSGTQSWECALDLHQGDAGTLTLERANDNVEGVIRFTRNESVFESNISGSWVDDKINLTRLLGTDNSESMSGIALVLGTKKVNIGGRFSTDYQGVWSADCDLVSELAEIGSTQAEVDSEVQPSTSSRIRPNSPSNLDSITFSALASHPEGIEKVSFFLGDKEIHSCNAPRCEFNYGRLAPGSYPWRVEAVSNNGIKTLADTNRVIVLDNAKTGNCTISGHAIGQSAPLAEVYLVKLYGPGNANLLNSTTGFENGRYQFSNLPAGEYQLLIDTRGDQEILASPSKTQINCQSQSSLTQDIEFR